MYGIKKNKCLEEFEVIRFQDTLEFEGNDKQIRVFRHNRIKDNSAVIVNFSGGYYQNITFNAVVGDGVVQVIITNTGDDSFPLTYNVTVL